MKILLRILLIFIVFGTLVFLGMNSYRYLILKRDAENIIKQLKAGEYSVIQRDDQSVNLDKVPEEYRDDIEQSLQEQKQVNENENGKEFWDKILSKTTIKAKPSFFSNKVTFVISGPDMSGFFQNVEAGGDKDAGQLFSDYMDTAKERTSSYTAHTTGGIGNWKVDISDLQNQKFIDCLSGGLLSSYADAYQQAIDEMLKEEIQ